MSLKLYLDSRGRDSRSVSNEDCIFRLEPGIRSIKTLILQNISIHGAYVVRTGINNSLTFNEGGGNLTATITPGNYTASRLATEVKTQMDAAGGFTYTVTYSLTTMKFTITAGSAFTILFATGTTQINTILGYTATDKGSATSHTSENVANLTGETEVYVQSKKLSSMIKRNYLSAASANTALSNVILKFPIRYSEPGEFLYYEPVDEERYLFSCHPERGEHCAELLDIDFKLVYFDGETVDLNAQNWSLTLIIETTDEARAFHTS